MMEPLKAFVAEFWPSFIGVMIGVSLAWSFGHSSYPPFLSAEAFPELAPFNEVEKQRLLGEASAKAFPGWRWYIPVFAFAMVGASGVALARFLRIIGVIPDASWASAVLSAIFGGAAVWVVNKLVIRYIRPMLNRTIATSTTLP